MGRRDRRPRARRAGARRAAGARSAGPRSRGGVRAALGERRVDRRLRADRAGGRLRRRRRSAPGPAATATDWVLDGTKRFITNAGVAHTYVVFARAEAGITAFMVEADDPGFSVGRIEPKMGIKGSTTGELLMDGCRIPGDRLIGAEGEGFRIAMRVLDRSRPGDRRPGARDRPGRARLRARLRRRADRVRKADRRPAGHPVHARRHGRRSSRAPAGCSTASRRCSTPASTAPS